MADSHQEQNKNWAKVIAALLANPSVGVAAKSCGVGERTVWRYMQDAEFQRQYKQAQRAVVDSAIANLQSATEKAVDTLISNLDCGNDFAENAAATTIINQALKAIELRELIARVDELEKQAKQGPQAKRA